MSDHPELFQGRRVSVIPVSSKNKRPLLAEGEITQFFERQATDEEIAKWIETLRPESWGIELGKVSDSMFVIDIDSLDAANTIPASLIDKVGNFGPTLIVRSSPGEDGQSGKLHLYYRDASGVVLKQKNYKWDTRFPGALPHVDLKAHGGYVLIPGSLHPKGHRYEIVADGPVADVSYSKVRLILDALDKHWPLVAEASKFYASGSMHFTDIGLAAYLYHRGFEREEAEVLMAALAYSVDPPADLGKVMEDFRYTWDRAEGGGEVGYREHLVPELIDKIAALPDRVTHGSSKEDHAVEAMRERLKIETPEIAPKAMVPEAEAPVPVVGGGPKMMRASELVMKYKDVKLPWVAPELLLKGEVTLLVGSAKVGKSTFVLQLLQRVTTGAEWAFGTKATKRRHAAIYYSLEMGEVPLAKRIWELFGGKQNIPDNLWIVTTRDYQIDWVEMGEKVIEADASVVVIDNLLGTNVGDLNKQEVASKIMNAAFAFAQDMNVAVVIVHHTRKGARTDRMVNQQQTGDAGDILDEASGSKVFANRAGIIVFIRKTTGGKKNTYAEISLVSRFGQSKVIKAIFDRDERGKWRRRTKEDQSQEDEGNAELEEDDEGEEGTEMVKMEPQESVPEVPVPKVVLPDPTHIVPVNPGNLRNVPNVRIPKVQDDDEPHVESGAKFYDKTPTPPAVAAARRAGAEVASGKCPECFETVKNLRHHLEVDCPDAKRTRKPDDGHSHDWRFLGLTARLDQCVRCAITRPSR